MSPEALLPMNEALMYVISGEKSREKSRDKNLKARKKVEKGESEHKICMALPGLRIKGF